MPVVVPGAELKVAAIDVRRYVIRKRKTVRSSAVFCYRGTVKSACFSPATAPLLSRTTTFNCTSLVLIRMVSSRPVTMVARTTMVTRNEPHRRRQRTPGVYQHFEIQSPPCPDYAYRSLLTITLSGLLLALQAQTTVTTPKQQFGFNIGDDYSLANYTQYVDYLKKLDRESDRLTVQRDRQVFRGRAMYLAIVTSPANQRNLTRYQEIAGRLAHAEGLTDDQARRTRRRRPAVVWIDGGIHANEVLGRSNLSRTSISSSAARMRRQCDF
jgi:hypothetical protein